MSFEQVKSLIKPAMQRSGGCVVLENKNKIVFEFNDTEDIEGRYVGNAYKIIVEGSEPYIHVVFDSEYIDSDMLKYATELMESTKRCVDMAKMIIDNSK